MNDMKDDAELLNRVSARMKVIFNRRLGAWSRVFAPGYGACHKCKTPWRFVRPHLTPYEPTMSCFPLCERCWEESSIPDRLVYYAEMFIKWQDRSVNTWNRIEEAVRAGL